MSEPDSYNADDSVYDPLVAYLDGELDAESSLQIERRLAVDEDFRQELQRLQRAWDMLDELPKAEVGESFTQTTVEMVALSAEQELEEQSQAVTIRRRLGWLVGIGGLAATAVASYLIVASILARPNQQLLKDLPVIEDFDLYRVAESVEYLRQLDESGLFDEEVQDEL